MNTDDLGVLYDDHADDLFSFLAYRTGDRAHAEDLVAETFLRALRSRSRFDRRKGSQKTWLYSIATNLLRDWGRRREVENRALERVGADGGHHDPVERADSRLSVMDAVAQLTEVEREAVALRFGADMTLPEIATVTGEALTTVEGRVYRALRKLGDRMPVS